MMLNEPQHGEATTKLTTPNYMRVKLSSFWGGMDKRSLSVPSCKLQQLKILWVRVVTIPRWRGQGVEIGRGQHDGQLLSER